MAEQTVFYAGSFDPPTKGHIDIIARGSKLYDKLVVGVGINIRKQALLTYDERVALLKKATREFPGVSVVTYEGLTVGYAQKIGATALIRGLRNPTDFHLEFHMAVANKTLTPELETVFLMSTPHFAFINSYLVREIAESGGDITPFIPKEIVEDLKSIILQRVKL